MSSTTESRKHTCLACLAPSHCVVPTMGLEVLLRVREPERGDSKQPIVVKLLDRHHCAISKDAAVIPLTSKEGLASLSKPFNFDHIFDINVAQFSIYQYALPLITSTFQQGGNTAILMYGEHGSGKTHTLVGGGNQKSIQQHPDRRGLIVRAAEDLFQLVKQLNSGRNRINHRIRVALIGIEAEKLTDMVAEQKGQPSAVYICEDPTLGTTVTPRTVISGQHSSESLSTSNTPAGILGNQYMHHSHTATVANMQSHIEVTNMKEMHALINIFVAYRHRHAAANCIFTICLDQIEMTSFPLAAHHASTESSELDLDDNQPKIAAPSTSKFSMKCVSKLHFVEMPIASPSAMQSPPASELATPTGFFKERTVKSPARSHSAEKARQVAHLDSVGADASSRPDKPSKQRVVSASRVRSGSVSNLMHSGTALLHTEHTASHSVLTRHLNSARKAPTPVDPTPHVSLVQAKHISQAQDALMAVIQALHKLPVGTTHVPYRNSKLTHYLQDAFSTHGHSLFICTIRPTVNHFDPTLVTLRFGQRIFMASHSNIPIPLLEQTIARNSKLDKSFGASTKSPQRRRSNKHVNSAVSVLQLSDDESVNVDGFENDEDLEFQAAEEFSRSGFDLSAWSASNSMPNVSAASTIAPSSAPSYAPKPEKFHEESQYHNAMESVGQQSDKSSDITCCWLSADASRVENKQFDSSAVMTRFRNAPRNADSVESEQVARLNVNSFSDSRVHVQAAPVSRETAVQQTSTVFSSATQAQTPSASPDHLNSKSAIQPDSRSALSSIEFAERIPLAVAFPVVSPSASRIDTSANQSADVVSSDSGAVGMFTVRERGRLLKETQDLLQRLQKTLDFLKGPPENLPDRVWFQAKNRYLDDLQTQIISLTQHASMMAQSSTITFGGNASDWEAELSEKQELNIRLLECQQQILQKSKDADILARYSADISNDTRLLATLTHRLETQQLECQRWRLDSAMWQRECHRLSNLVRRTEEQSTLAQQFEHLQKELQNEALSHSNEAPAAQPEVLPSVPVQPQVPQPAVVAINQTQLRSVSPVEVGKILPPVSSATSGSRLASLADNTLRSFRSVSNSNSAEGHMNSKSSVSSAIASLLRETDVHQPFEQCVPSAGDLKSLAASFSSQTQSSQQYRGPESIPTLFGSSIPKQSFKSISPVVTNAVSSAFSSPSDLVPSFEASVLFPTTSASGSLHSLSITASPFDLNSQSSDRNNTASNSHDVDVAPSFPWRARLEQMSDSADLKISLIASQLQ